MEENKEKVEILEENSEINAENITDIEESEITSSEDVVTSEKTKVTFDEKVDKTADFIKKHKIKLLCGIVAILALVIGVFVGSFFAGNGDNEEDVSSYQSSISESENSGDDAVLTTSPTVISPAETQEPAVETQQPVQTEQPATQEEEVIEETISYVDLLDSMVYFSESVDLSMSEADVISLLNNVLTASSETVTAGGVEADSKIAVSDTVNVSVTKAEMKALLDDLGATFTNIDQSVSGDILTLDVDMHMEIPEEVLASVQANSNFIVSAIISSMTTNLTFSYQVSYQMDGESLVPIAVSSSTIDINGYGTIATQLIASVALSSYSSANVDTATLLAGYNSMAGEIIADILNNYGIVTGATASEINITTRTND